MGALLHSSPLRKDSSLLSNEILKTNKKTKVKRQEDKTSKKNKEETKTLYKITSRQQ